MANKTLILKGMTATTVGVAGTEAPLDITEKVLSVYPEIGATTNTDRFFSTIAKTVVEGKAKFLLKRKSHINRYNTTKAIHEDGSVGKESQGTISTALFKSSVRDAFEFILNKSWDTGFAYDKKKDPKVNEGKLIEDLGSLQSDIKEEKANDFWLAIDTDVLDAADSKSILHKTYVSTRDGKTKDAPALVKEFTSAPGATFDSARLNSAKLVDTISQQIREISLWGKKGTANDGYPYSRGTKGKLGLEIVVKENVKEIISLDPRFIPTGSAEEIVRTGIIGLISNVPVTLDDDFEASSTKDWAILPKGQYGVVIEAEELPDSFMTFDHPTKPTRTKLLEGSGAWDTYVTPHINLARFGKIKV